MKLDVQLFAVARDWAGSDRLQVELPAGATVAQLRLQIAKLLPQIAEAGQRFAIAINDEYAGERQSLQEHDAVALIPPVSGG